MASKLKEAKSGTLTGTKVTSTTITSEKEQKKEVPKGATIVRKSVRTETEQIENGWLISKNYDIQYKMKSDGYTEYAYYTKKWYTKDDPLEVKLTDASLADEFMDE